MVAAEASVCLVRRVVLEVVGVKRRVRWRSGGGDWGDSSKANRKEKADLLRKLALDCNRGETKNRLRLEKTKWCRPGWHHELLGGLAAVGDFHNGPCL